MKEFEQKFCNEIQLGGSLWIQHIDAVKKVKDFLRFKLTTLISQARREGRESVTKDIRKYQSGFAIEHYNGPDDPPEVEFTPEYGVIENLLSALTTEGE